MIIGATIQIMIRTSETDPTMYIRKSIREYKGRSYTNYLLVESVATPKESRQKTICSLGA